MAPESTTPEPRHWWLALMLGLLCVTIGVRAWCPLLGSDDFWAHAAVGRWIWQHGDVPRHTLYLWTAEEPWVAHSWLGELGLYGLLATGGTRLVQIITLLVVAAPFALLFALWRRTAPVSTTAVLAVGLAINASATRFEARPELLTSLFLAVLFAMLIVWSEIGAAGQLDRRSLAILGGLPLLFAMWVNCHGQVANGMVLLALTVACDLVQDRANKRSLLLALTSVGAAAVLVLNPYGIGYLDAFRVVNSATFAGIREWQPFWADPPMPATIVAPAFLLVGLAMFAWRVNPARRWSHFVWLVFMMACFLRASRFVSMLNLTSLAVLAANAKAFEVERFWRQWNRLPEDAAIPHRLVWLARGGVVVTLVLLLADVPGRWVEVASQGRFTVPMGVADYLEKNRPAGRIFNDYENSSYLHWRFGGAPPLFIDLLNAYPDSVTKEYRDIVQATSRGKELLDERGIGVVILTRHREGLSLEGLDEYLRSTATWNLAYAGEDGRVWVRKR